MSKVPAVLRGFFSSEPDFFGLLLQHAEKVQQGVSSFHRFLETGELDAASEVRALEKDADELRRELRSEIFDSFSTPIDREDLFYLSRRLDEVINYVKHTLRDAQILEVKAGPLTREMSAVLVEGASHLVEAVRHLPARDATCQRNARAAKNCENDITKLYPRALKAVFERDDFKEILKRQDLLQNLSHIGDRIDEAADVILHIVIKEW